MSVKADFAPFGSTTRRLPEAEGGSLPPALILASLIYQRVSK